MAEKPLLEEAFGASSYITDDEPDAAMVFSPEEPIQEDTYSLLYLGHLSDTVTIGTHQIHIRTLKIGEELNAALLANRYKDTVEEGRALATALVAASIVSVDDGPLVGQLIGPGDDSIEVKFNYILNNWYWESVRQVWDAYNKLLVRIQESTEEIKKE